MIIVFRSGPGRGEGSFAAKIYVMRRMCIFLLAILAGFGASAGTISGKVTDVKDTSAMIGVIVSIQGSARAAQTDLDGHYEIQDLPDGTYTLEFNYVSYTKQAFIITLRNGGNATQDVVMKAPGNQLAGTTVHSTKRTNTESSVILEMKKSNVIVSGISAAQISKTMDRNAADVVKRIPGVTVQDDRFITVRGLADRYNTVWLNDAGAPSSEVDKKSFSFDIIPSGLIDRILIYKTPSAELPGDFAGGMVKIYTTSLPDKNTYTFSLQSSYRSGSTGTDFNYNQRSSTDWLGYDDGMRSIPAGVPAVIDKNASGNEAQDKFFTNDWIIYRKKQSLDLRLSGSASNIFKLGKVKIGNTFGVSYSSTGTNYAVQRYEWEDTSKVLHNNDLQSISKVNVGLLENLVVSAGNSKIELRNLYNQVGTSTVVTRTNVRDTDLVLSGLAQNERAYAMGYDSRATYSAQLSGSHHNDADTRKYNWTLGYTDLFRNQPSLRRIRYTQDEYGVYSAQVQGGTPDIVNGGGRFYAELYEHIYSFSHQFTQKIRVTDKFDFDLSLGNYIEYKSRFFNARELGYTLRRQGDNGKLLELPINEIFDPANTGTVTSFRIAENTHDYDHYNADNRLIASFLSLNVPVTTRLKAVVGVRYEDNLYNLKALYNQRLIEPSITTDFFLPSINLSYNFSSKSLLRLAYGKTINRPEFRETAPFYFYDFERRAGTYGALYLNDTLKVAQIHNIDARYEWYPSAGEMLQAGVFYKHFRNPIQQISSYVAGERVFAYLNGDESYVYGLELDARKNLGFIGDRIGAGFLNNITLVGNLTVAKSELTVDTAASSTAMDVLKKSTTEGQSKYVVNVGAFYQNDSLNLQASLLYNVYGSRLYALGTTYDPSIGELPFNSLDFTLSKTIYKHYIITAGVQNVLGQSVRFVIDTDKNSKFDNKSDKPFSSYSPGRYFSLGVKLRF